MKIEVQCVGCKAKKHVGPEQRDMPMCDRCFMPMIATEAKLHRGGAA